MLLLDVMLLPVFMSLPVFIQLRSTPPRTVTFYFACICCSYSILNGQTETFAIVSFTLNQWFHAVVIYQGPQDVFTVYHDTTQVGTSTNYGRGASKGTGQMLIGAMAIEGAPKYSSVAVDEVKMWNRQISEDEINNMYP